MRTRGIATHGATGPFSLIIFAFLLAASSVAGQTIGDQCGLCEGKKGDIETHNGGGISVLHRRIRIHEGPPVDTGDFNAVCRWHPDFHPFPPRCFASEFCTWEISVSFRIEGGLSPLCPCIGDHWHTKGVNTPPPGFANDITWGFSLPGFCGDAPINISGVRLELQCSQDSLVTIHAPNFDWAEIPFECTDCEGQ